MFYKTWFITTESFLRKDSPVCFVFSEYMANKIVSSNVKYSIDKIGGLEKAEILRNFYHDYLIIDDLVSIHSEFVHEEFNIICPNDDPRAICKYYPIVNWRNSKIDSILDSDSF